MNVALLLARLVLSVVFMVAGLAKLADVSGSQKAIHDFGVPQLLAKPLGLLLPCAEVAVAIALIPLASAWWAALVALLLLVAFTAGISYNLLQGRTPACHCFGQLSSAPAGRSTLRRNIFLALVAVFLAVFGHSSTGLSATSWFGVLTLAQRLELLTGVIVVALLMGESWLLLQTLRQYGRLLLRLERLEHRLAEEGIWPASPSKKPGELQIGAPAPNFTLPDLNSIPVSLTDFRGSMTLLLFWSPACGFCKKMLSRLQAWEANPPQGAPKLLIISDGTEEENRVMGLRSPIVLDNDGEVMDLFGADGTPMAILIDAQGNIASTWAEDAPNVFKLAGYVKDTTQLVRA